MAITLFLKHLNSYSQMLEKYQHQTKVELVANYKVQEPIVWVYIQRGNKYLKSVSVKSEALPAGARRWQQKSEDSS